MTKKDRYAVFGNPIKHSKSPQIHHAFAEQTQQSLRYRAVLVKKGKFAESAKAFFAEGGKGLNVTVPFKAQAYEFAQVLSDRARRAGAVNTLGIDKDGRIFGDNTDGIGLVRDMVVNLGWRIGDTKVLIAGAGGAARGVLEPILKERPRSVTIVNRTASKAKQLAKDFADLGNVKGGAYKLIGDRQFDLVINATSAGLEGGMPELPASLLNEKSCCYDMVYGDEPTVFSRWAAQNAAWAVSDGLGMLVEQAAESFYLWRKVRPETQPVIRALREG